MKKILKLPEGACAFFLPNTCPRCGKGMAPNVHSSDLSHERNRIAFILSCPICEQFFFSTHAIQKDTDDTLLSVIESVLPHEKSQSSIPEMLRQDYPYFYQIYGQAAEAEAHGLNEISGMAYRKALEILVKQYLIKKNPTEESFILKEPLGASIERISFDKIRNLAKAISWIGNDQTHIIQKHPDYNVSEMKTFMQALCFLVASEYVADTASAFVSS